MRGHSRGVYFHQHRLALTVIATLAAAGLLSACGTTPSDPPPPKEPTTTTLNYGTADAQVADLTIPAALGDSPSPVVVLIHGGYWRSGYDRTLEHDVAADLVEDGYVVWNIDYRAADGGGGWPGTFDDVAAAVDALPAALEDAGIEQGRTAVVGHSAGGTLALWLAARPGLPDDTPGTGPAVVPDVVVSQAGVNDLERASATGAGSGAVDALLGGRPDQVPDRYALASPIRQLPLGVPTLVITGADDLTVPVEQTELFARAAERAGDPVTEVIVPSEDHFAHLDPASTSWAETREFLSANL